MLGAGLLVRRCRERRGRDWRRKRSKVAPVTGRTIVVFGASTDASVEF